MNTEERNLISGLFDRMGQFGALEKDRDADALIAQAVRANPDAPYMLVQSVLVQEQALQQADSRIRELEARTRELRIGVSASGTSGGWRQFPRRHVRPWRARPVTRHGQRSNDRPRTGFRAAG